jgi:hypothetical protein
MAGEHPCTQVRYVLYIRKSVASFGRINYTGTHENRPEHCLSMAGEHPCTHLCLVRTRTYEKAWYRVVVLTTIGSRWSKIPVRRTRGDVVPRLKGTQLQVRSRNSVDVRRPIPPIQTELDPRNTHLALPRPLKAQKAQKLDLILMHVLYIRLNLVSWVQRSRLCIDWRIIRSFVHTTERPTFKVMS